MLRWSPLSPALCLLLLLVAASVVAPLAVGGAAAQADESTGFAPGETVFRVELDADGDAHWQIVERIPLNSSTEEAAFVDLAESFEAGDVDLERTAAVEAAADAVDSRTDRQMSLTDPDRTSDITGQGDNRTGTLTVSFTWRQFARTDTDGARLYVDDVFDIDGTPWLSTLTADQRLVVVPPEGYGVLDAAVSPRDGKLVWEGPTDLDSETLSVTLLGDQTGDDTPPDDSTDDGTDDGGLDLAGLVLVGVVVAVLAAAVAAVSRNRDRLGDLLDRDPEPAETGDSATDGGNAASPPDSVSADGVDTEPPAEVGPAATTVTTTEADTATGGLDEDLLSDEERVERLLERNGGRMRQANIVDETGWSNAKVSQLLSSMEEEDRIDKLRIGRENLISFPDIEVTDLDDDP